MRFRPSQWTLLDRAMILVVVPFLVECALLGWLVSVHGLRQEEARIESRSRQIIQLSNELTQAVYDVGRIVRKSTIKSHTFPSEFYTNASIGIPRTLEKLKELTADNGRVRAIVQDIEKGAMFLAHDTARVHALVMAHPDWNTYGILPANYWPAMRHCAACVERLHNYVDPMTREARARQLQLMRRSEQLILGGLVTNVLLALGLALFFARSTTNRLAVVIDNTRRIAGKEPLHKPLDGSDEIAYLDKVVTDVGIALNDLEERERALINNATELLCSLDANQCFAYVNAACQGLLGYTREELSTMTLSMLVADKDSAPALAAVKNISESLGSGKFACRLVRKDGTLIDTMWVCQWSADESVLFSVVHDISERVRLESARQNLVAMVNHDLRTPLNTVIAFYEILASTNMFGALDDRGQSKVTATYESLEAIMRSISDLLDLEKAEAGQIQLEMDDQSLTEIVARAGDQVQARAGARSVTLATQDVSGNVRADYERLVQVVYHLLLNAVERAPAGSSVAMATKPEGSEQVIEITDESSLGPEQVDTFFDRFGSPSQKQAGHVGLALASHIVHLHGGQIGVTSLPGQGTKIWFKLPG